MSISNAQNKNFDQQLRLLTKQIDSVVLAKNQALQKTIDSINYKVSQKKYTLSEGELLKKEAVKQYADDVDFYIFKKTSALKKWTINQEIVNEVTVNKHKTIQYTIRVISQKNRNKQEKSYNRRSYSRFVLGFGFNNILTNKQFNSLNESPYGLWQSRFLELGVHHKTALSPKSRFVYFTYGASLVWNTLKPTHNKTHVIINDTVQLVDFGQDLSTNKLRNVWLKVPIGMEFHIATSKYNHLKFAIGAYAKLRIKTKQKLIFEEDNTDNTIIQKGAFNVNGLNYGFNAAIGENDWSIYVNYDLNNLFKHHDWHQISLGLKWEMF